MEDGVGGRKKRGQGNVKLSGGAGGGMSLTEGIKRMRIRLRNMKGKWRGRVGRMLETIQPESTGGGQGIRQTCLWMNFGSMFSIPADYIQIQALKVDCFPAEDLAASKNDSSGSMNVNITFELVGFLLLLF